MRLALLLFLIPTVAAADDVIPIIPAAAAKQVGEANLEPDHGLHKGNVALAFALAPDMVFGTGTGADVGTGGVASIRIGAVATPDTVISLELDAGTVLVHKHAKDLFGNSATNLTIGAQWFIVESAWLRLGGGIGNYTRRGLFDTVGAPLPDEPLSGPVGVFGAGMELVHIKRLVVDLELVSSLLLERHGTIVVGGIGIGFARY